MGTTTTCQGIDFKTIASNWEITKKPKISTYIFSRRKITIINERIIQVSDYYTFTYIYKSTNSTGGW